MLLNRIIAILVIFVLLTPFSGNAQTQTFNAGKLEYRYGLLKRGVNLNFWVEEKSGELTGLDDPSNRFDDADAVRLKKLGITHLRLAVSPYPLLKDLHFSEENFRSETGARFLGEIHRIIKICLAHNLPVVLAVMARDDVKAKLYYDKKYVDEWAGFFWNWGHEFKQYDPDRLLFETINEPDNYAFMARDSRFDKYDSETRLKYLPRANDIWLEMQEEFMTALRANAPEHTLIATSDDKSNHDALSMTFPLSDPNVIYAFHYYYPFVFTHQGADWTEMPAAIDSLTYPSYYSNCQMVQETVGKKEREAVEYYCKDEWNRTKHAEELGALFEWAKRYGVKVWASEFGAFPNKSDKSSVYNFLFDVRSTLEDYHFGWCAWEYGGWLGRLESKQTRSALGVK